MIVLTLALGLPLGCNSQSGLESKIQGTNIQKVERIKNKPVQDPNINPLIQKPNIQEYSEKNDKYNLNEVIIDFNEVRTLVNRIYNSFTGKKLSNDLDIKILLEIEMIQRYRRLGGKGPIPKGFSNSESKKAYIKAGNICDVLIHLFHEIGHIDEKPLEKRLDEEAQSYALLFGCFEEMKRLGYDSIVNEILERLPDSYEGHKDGYHAKAYDKVRNLMKLGFTAHEIYDGISGRDISVE